jgi:hypothetical protein
MYTVTHECGKIFLTYLSFKGTIGRDCNCMSSRILHEVRIKTKESQNNKKLFSKVIVIKIKSLLLCLLGIYAIPVADRDSCVNYPSLSQHLQLGPARHIKGKVALRYFYTISSEIAYK